MQKLFRSTSKQQETIGRGAPSQLLDVDDEEGEITLSDIRQQRVIACEKAGDAAHHCSRCQRYAELVRKSKQLPPMQHRNFRKYTVTPASQEVKEKRRNNELDELGEMPPKASESKVTISAVSVDQVVFERKSAQKPKMAQRETRGMKVPETVTATSVQEKKTIKPANPVDNFEHFASKRVVEVTEKLSTKEHELKASSAVKQHQTGHKSKLEERLERLSKQHNNGQDDDNAAKDVTTSLAIDLKTVVFGSSLKTLQQVWRSSGFAWRHEPFWGIKQSQSGPGAVICVVQAEVIRYLLFESPDASSMLLRSTRCAKLRVEALSWAMATVVWRCASEEVKNGEKKCCVFNLSARATVDESKQFRRDGVTECLSAHYFNKFADTKSFFEKFISQYDLETGSGVLLLLYSAVASRGTKRCISDMDYPESMVSHLGDSQMSLVNLLISGIASNHVFNGSIQLDDMVSQLNGVRGRCNVGLLSDLSGGMDSVEVGSYLKCPRFPIWLVIRDSQFLLCFSTCRDLVNDWKMERRFELIYYNPQWKNDGCISIRFDATDFGKNDLVRMIPIRSFDDEEAAEKRLTSLELAFKMKWPDADIEYPKECDASAL